MTTAAYVQAVLYILIAAWLAAGYAFRDRE
jgi:hypothetical protein